MGQNTHQQDTHIAPEQDDGNELRVIKLNKQSQNMPTIKILVACHKPEIVVQNDIICPIAVGADNDKKIPFQLKDNIGDDSISHLNARFCELTAQYWAYKNLKADYYGFFHYRRYLSFNHPDTKVEIKIPGIYNNIEEDFGLNETNILKLLQSADMILPQPIKCVSNYKHYKAAHDVKDLDFCLRYISQKFPQYNNAVQKYMKSNLGYYCNMFVTNKEIFFEYSKWLFDILMAFDNQKDYTDLNSQQLRTVGYLGERLLGIFVTHIQLTRPDIKIAHVPFVIIKNTQNNTPHIAKKKYGPSIADSVANVIIPRGTRAREYIKRVYIAFLGGR
ncbi:MAG: DUF4422 domain-containing protein [Firmicutes bacterium]|nr:DUF4422 domain-containing protein [Bacillota bacterium]MCL1953745.1 DUF4422 domain-containing protein [Bacillota bacterium]